MGISNYPNGFSNGISVKGFPFVVQQNGLGKTFWVDSVNGSNSNKGNSTYPLATIAGAVNLCVASRGDIIMVAAGHSETIANITALDINKAGVQIIGLGAGESRPTITFATSTAAAAVVSANDVSIHNLLFKCNIASQLTMIWLNAKRTTVSCCRFEEGSATGLNFVNINGGTANACDGVQVLDCEFYAPTAGNYNHAIELGEVADQIMIKGCYAEGDFDDACIHNPAAKVLTNMVLDNCILSNVKAGIHAVELVSACTGFAIELKMYTSVYASTFDPGSLKCIQCYSVNQLNANGVLNPAAQ